MKKMRDWFTKLEREAEERKLRELLDYEDLEGLLRELEHCRPKMRQLVIFTIGCMGPKAKTAVPILIKLSEDFKCRYNYDDDWRNSTIVPFSDPPGVDAWDEFQTYLSARLALRKIEGLEQVGRLYE